MTLAAGSLSRGRHFINAKKYRSFTCANLAVKKLRRSYGLPSNTVFEKSWILETFPPESIVTPLRAEETRTLFNKTPGGNDNYHADAHGKEGRWAPSFKLGRRKSTLGNLPEDESNFPVSTSRPASQMPPARPRKAAPLAAPVEP